MFILAAGIVLGVFIALVPLPYVLYVILLIAAILLVLYGLYLLFLGARTAPAEGARRYRRW